MPNHPRVTVCGSGAAGQAIAADCAFKGCGVVLFDLAPFADRVASLAERGGIEVTPDSVTTSGKTGFVGLGGVHRRRGDGRRRRRFIMVTAPAMYHDVFMDALAPHLQEGQTVLFNTGYWGSLRQTDGWGSVCPV